MLYLLSYSRHEEYFIYGTPEGTRTPDTRLRRAVLYPAELLAHKCQKSMSSLAFAFD